MSKAIIFAGGTISGIEKIDFTDAYIICVDSGTNYAIKKNIKIDIAIGDFDSASESSIEYIKDNKINVLAFNKDKDKTDLELALEYVLENKLTDVIIFGATGTRFDHSMTNILLLKTYTNKGLNIKIIDAYNEIFFVNNRKKILKKDKYISILPTDEETIISIKGVKWPLNHHKMVYGSSYTNSNEFVDDAIIDIHKGSVYVILSKD